MSASDQPPDDFPSLPKDYRFRPSNNQKRRSKLGQAAEESSPPPAPIPEAPKAAPPPPEPAVRRHRLKRSGQMHEDLTAPIPDDKGPVRPEPEY